MIIIIKMFSETTTQRIKGTSVILLFIKNNDPEIETVVTTHAIITALIKAKMN